MEYQEKRIEMVFNILTNFTYNLVDRVFALSLIDNIDNNTPYILRGEVCKNYRMEITDESEIDDGEYDIIRLSFDDSKKELYLMTNAFELLVQCDRIVVMGQSLES